MKGYRTGVNPIDNALGSSTNTVGSVITAMNPNIAVAPLYEFAPLGTLVNTLNVTDTTVMKFSGDAFTDALLSYNNLLNILKDTFTIANLFSADHSGFFTLLHYTEYLESISPNLGYDPLCVAESKHILNIHAFDPKYVTSDLTRLLPYVEAPMDEITNYQSLTGEKVSISTDTMMFEKMVPQFSSYVHDPYGFGFETSDADIASTSQSTGGGFFGNLVKKALPVISALGSSVADGFFPGSGEIVQQLGDRVADMLGSKQHAHLNEVLDNVNYYSSRNPYNPTFRPFQTGMVDMPGVRCAYSPPMVNLHRPKRRRRRH
jgi:hypothetical protein